MLFVLLFEWYELATRQICHAKNGSIQQYSNSVSMLPPPDLCYGFKINTPAHFQYRAMTYTYGSTTSLISFHHHCREIEGRWRGDMQTIIFFSRNGYHLKLSAAHLFKDARE